MNTPRLKRYYTANYGAKLIIVGKKGIIPASDTWLSYTVKNESKHTRNDYLPTMFKRHTVEPSLTRHIFTMEP